MPDFIQVNLRGLHLSHQRDRHSWVEQTKNGEVGYIYYFKLHYRKKKNIIKYFYPLGYVKGLVIDTIIFRRDCKHSSHFDK